MSHCRGGNSYYGGYGGGYYLGYSDDYHYDRRGGGIVLHGRIGFDGRYVHITDNISDLGRIGFNDRTTSIEVLSGVWELCTGRHYNGYCFIVDSNIRNLRNYGVSNEITSVRRVSGRRHGRYRHSGYYGDHRGNDNYGVGVYANRGYDGDYFQVGIDIEDFSIYAAGYDGSLEVLGGRWEVCESSHYRGRCTTVEGRYDDLRSNLGFSIGSIRHR